MNTAAAHPGSPGARLLARRQFLTGLVAAGALVALPAPASAATASSYGRGYQAGGYR